MNADVTPSSTMKLIGPAFNDQEIIPEQYTCKGEDINPPLIFVDVPESAKSLALIMHDPDAVGSDFLHWIIWDISPAIKSIATNSVPTGAIQGHNDKGNNTYMGPCPPKGSGMHHYIFELYALDTTLGLSPSSSRKELEDAMKGHQLAHHTLTGLVDAGN